MSDFDYHKLDNLIHSKVRLGIIAALVAAESVDFSFLKEKLDLTDGNLSVNMKKLEEAGYIKTKKTFIKHKPNTSYRITAKGKKAFDRYLENLKKILDD
ncbi:MAG: transcriptional regulator [Bacteroidales bacterium]|nr:transcriptional regulator [Candidatus Latescibacterota bacterium]